MYRLFRKLPAVGREAKHFTVLWISFAARPLVRPFLPQCLMRDLAAFKSCFLAPSKLQKACCVC